jgi:hypothetical protein
LTNSGDGPTFKVVDNDQLYPYRSKELIAKLSQVLGPKVASPYDILLVRKRYEVDANPNFSHKGRFGTRQYMRHSSNGSHLSTHVTTGSSKPSAKRLAPVAPSGVAQ